MKTDSLKDLLEMNFGYKDTYSNYELESINSITINRFNIVDEINNIDYTELLLFNNLKSLTINQCIIDNFVMSIILKIENLENLIFNNCEFIDEPKYFFINLKIKSLIIDNTKFELNLLEHNYYEYLVLSNILINEPLCLNVGKLDIKKCNIKDYTFLESNINTLVVSSYQYDNNIVFTNYKKYIVIMEDNGQMIKEEVNK